MATLNNNNIPPLTATPATPSLSDSNILAAVNFLSNTKVANSSISKRLAFLESKGLSSDEILEALRRINSNSDEYKAVLAGIRSGKKASELVIHLDNPIPSTTNIPLVQAGLSTAPINTSQAYPYPYPYPYPPPAAPVVVNQSSSWRDWLISSAAVLGLSTSAILLAGKYLPKIQFVPRESYNDSNNTANNPTSDSIHSSAVSQLNNMPSNNTPYPAAGVNNSSLLDYSSSNPRDRYNLSTLNDESLIESKESELVRTVNELKGEFSEFSSLFRDQNLELRRLFESIKQSLDTFKEKDKFKTEISATLLSIKTALETMKASNNNTTENRSTNADNQVNDSKSSEAEATKPILDTAAVSNSSNWFSNGDSNNSPQHAGAEEKDSSASIENEDLYDEGVKNLRDAVNLIRRENRAEEAQQAMKTLLLYISNILTHIDQPRYKKILTTNPTFEKVKKIKGAELFLTSCGFQFRGPFCEWNPNEPDDSNNTPQRQQLNQKLLKEAQEILKQSLQL
jgi:hypothetical protein